MMNLDHFDTILAFAAVMAGLSLIITALTQAVSGVFGLRGHNLKWGLEKLFNTLAPGEDAKAEALAHHLLLHPLLSDSTFSGLKQWWTWWRYASHVRQEELTNLLKPWREALDMPQSTDQEKTARTTTLDALKKQASFSDDAAEFLMRHLKKIEDGLPRWFDSNMDRVAQRFTANMRLITIAGAAIVSLVLVVDSVELWKQLSANPELRSRVIATSDALLKKADEMQVGSTNLPAAVYRAAAAQLLSMHTNELAGFSGPEVITNLSSGTNWLATQCKNHGITNSARWLEEYQALVPQATLRQAADELHTLLEDQLALGVISSRRPNESWRAAFCGHWGGILASIVLLSLGAPFWFNLLRSFSNLRPVLATKDTEEQRARAKAIAAGKEAGR